jgi:MoaA/NifB/PqqE/SkfB family radical SAM enzyme
LSLPFAQRLIFFAGENKERRPMSVARAFIEAKVFHKPKPIDIAIEVTHRCNLNCIYCDRHTLLKNEMTTGEILALISDFHALGATGLSLDGGEPLTREDFPKIAQHISKLKMEFRLNTNGILVPKRIDWIKDVKKVKISLDGTAKQHDSMRGEGSFAKALEGIRVAKKAGLPVELTCVLHRRNLTCVKELLVLAATLDCRIIFQPVRKSLFNGGEREGNDWMPDYSELYKVFQWLLRQIKQNKYIKNKRASLEHFLHFPKDVRLPCNAGWLNCTVDPEGYLYHCGEINRAAYRINVREHGVAKAFKLLPRFDCGQCWCARTVEENFLWGLRLQKFF